MQLTRKQMLVVFGVMIVLAGAILLRSWLVGENRSQFSEVPTHPWTELGVKEFFAFYWQRPIPPQGAAPASLSEKEASLSPDACGSCHTQQYADWKESFHSRAMGPGPWGQIIDSTRNNPDEAVLCMTCHAPLSEQMPVVTNASGGEPSYVRNDRYDPQLQLRGITCAACHVRQHRRFGPPRAEAPGATQYPAGMANHGGVQRTPYFEKAEFCEGCHQFDPENTVLVNGKPIQDTYREWKNSSWGKGGADCQSCHMPQRRHLWRGIHDAEWVKGGVKIEAKIDQPASGPGTNLQLSMEVENAAVGHKFPTYITPKVFLRAALLDEREKAISGTEQEGVIGWDARFEGGEWREYFDTRVAPGERYRKSFRWKLPVTAKKAKVWVEVHPDHFYHVHFYPAYLQSENLSPEGRKLVEIALRESGQSTYILFEKLISIN